MSLISVELSKKNGQIASEISKYAPNENETNRINQVREALNVGYLNLTTPRKEFSDLSVLERLSVDNMSWNTYQPNDGNGFLGDEINSWRSNAIRPIVRNKAISIVAHATARMIFPKVFAQNSADDEDRDASMVMEDLIEWVVRNQSKYERKFLSGVISAVVNPYAIMHVEYVENYRTIKEMDEKGNVTSKEVIDEVFSGFQMTPLDSSEFYFENFYESDIQKQGFVVWRKVIPYSTAQSKYSKYKNFEYVKPGMQTIGGGDANNSFYNEYDSNLTGDLCEEVMYWNRSLDIYLIVCNGVLLTDCENPNPRLDKKYPFAKTYYEEISANCFAGKSLVFKMGPDARIVNDLYPMIIDGTYLQIFPPMFVKGSEEIGSDVIIPGGVTILSNPESDLKAISTNNNLGAGLATMNEVIKSLSQSSIDPLMQGDSQPGARTAYEVAKLQQNANSDLSLFMKMIGFFVEDIGNLMISDILQYMTIGQVEDLTTDGQMKLAYKTFLLPEKMTENGLKSKKIKFGLDTPSGMMSEDDLLMASYDVMAEEGGPDSKKTIVKVNPEVFRDNKYKSIVAPGFLNPLSDEVERALGLEAYDRAINNPRIASDADAMDNITRDFLLNLYPQSQKNPDKYFPKNKDVPVPPSAPMSASGAPNASNILNSVGAMSGGAPIPPRPNIGMK